MSNLPVQFKSKEREAKPPFEVVIDGESFMFRPRLGAKAFEAIARVTGGDLTGIFDLLKILMVDRVPVGHPEYDGPPYPRFLEMDMDIDDVMPLFEVIIKLYDINVGESPASSTSSADGEAKSTPTSNGSTRSTSTRSKAASTKTA